MKLYAFVFPARRANIFLASTADAGSGDLETVNLASVVDIDQFPRQNRNQSTARICITISQFSNILNAVTAVRGLAEGDKNFRTVLIVEYDVWPPYVVGWYVQHLNAAVFLWVPFQFVIVPRLQQKQRKNHSR